MTQADEDKKRLRKQAAIIRKQAFDAMPDAPVQIADYAPILQTRYAPKIIAAFWPIRTEIDPIPLLAALCQSGATSCLPVTGQEGKPLTFHQWDIGSQLADGPYHTKEPFGDTAIVIPDLILAPLLAFDAGCWRLGYGGGFYDRTIATLQAAGHHPHLVGVAFDETMVSHVPTGPYDKALSAVLTPSGLKLPLSENDQITQNDQIISD